MCTTEKIESAYETIAKREGWYQFSFTISDIIGSRTWQRRIPKLRPYDNETGTELSEGWFLLMVLNYINEYLEDKDISFPLVELPDYMIDLKTGRGLIKGDSVYALSLKYNYDNNRYDINIAKIDSVVDFNQSVYFSKSEEFLKEYTIEEKISETEVRSRYGKLIKLDKKIVTKRYDFKTGELKIIDSKYDTSYLSRVFH